MFVCYTRFRHHDNMSRGLFNEVLIIEVSKRPLLWDVKDNNFRNKSIKESLWEEVRDAIRAIDDTVTVEEIIARWKNLKDTYRRKIKDEKDGKKSGSGATAKTAWPHLKQMEFLRDSMETRRSLCNLDAVSHVQVASAVAETSHASCSPASPGSKEVEASPNEFESMYSVPGLPHEPGPSCMAATSPEVLPHRGNKRQKKRRQEVEAADRDIIPLARGDGWNTATFYCEVARN
ncbi:uncharacterized protein LOC144102787 [Amblyomma americanum]